MTTIEALVEAAEELEHDAEYNATISSRWSAARQAENNRRIHQARELRARAEAMGREIDRQRLTIQVGSRVTNRSYGVGTVEAIRHFHRGESIARVRFDCFVGTRNDRPVTTPLMGLEKSGCDPATT